MNRPVMPGVATPPPLPPVTRNGALLIARQIARLARGGAGGQGGGEGKRAVARFRARLARATAARLARYKIAFDEIHLARGGP